VQNEIKTNRGFWAPLYPGEIFAVTFLHTFLVGTNNFLRLLENINESRKMKCALLLTFKK
jgi:hypothetical protein